MDKYLDVDEDLQQAYFEKFGEPAGVGFNPRPVPKGMTATEAIKQALQTGTPLPPFPPVDPEIDY